MMEKKDIGKALKKMRKQSGLKWDVLLASLNEKYGINIAQSTIYGYENGHGSPEPRILLALCDLYGQKDLLHEFGYASVPIAKSDFGEDITLFEDDYSPENWAMIKNFISLVPAKDKK